MRLLAADRSRSAGLRPIAGDPGLPLLQRNLDVLRGTWMTDMSFYERFGEVTWTRAPGQDLVLAIGPEAAAAVLTSMLLEYDWSVPDDYVMPVSWKALPYPTDGLPITVTRRS